MSLPQTDATIKSNGVLYTIHNGYIPQPSTANGNGQAHSLTNIPLELRELKQWIDWRCEPRPTGKPAKIPRSPHAPQRPADVTNPQHWATFEQALFVMKRHNFDGIGFVFSEDDPFVGIDLDHCVNDNVISSPALYWLATFGSYAEYSPSGTGIHIIVKASLRLGRKVGDFEIYGQDRFFAMTGNRIPGTPGAIREAQEAVDLFVAHLDSLKPQQPHSDHAAVPQDKNVASLQPLGNSDYALLRRMFRAKNGQRLWAIWHGQDHENASIGDMILLSALAFWTGKDPGRMERMFRQSHRVRDKLDQAARTADGSYLEGTIRLAIQNCSKVYGGAR